MYLGAVLYGGGLMPFHRPVIQQESIDMLVSQFFQNSTKEFLVNFLDS